VLHDNELKKQRFGYKSELSNIPPRFVYPPPSHSTSNSADTPPRFVYPPPSHSTGDGGRWLVRHQPKFLDTLEDNPFENAYNLTQQPNGGLTVMIVIILLIIVLLFLFIKIPNADNYIINVDSKNGWQSTNIILNSGDILLIKYISGEWTVDYNVYEMVGPEGYHDAIDKQIWNPSKCKIIQSLPYGTLLGKINNKSIFKVGINRLLFILDSGELFLSINDLHECAWDNKGHIVVEIIVVR